MVARHTIARTRYLRESKLFRKSE